MEQLQDRPPQSVEAAVCLLSLTLVIELFQLIFLSRSITSPLVSSALLLAVLIFTYLFYGLLLVKIWHGRNWARVTYALILALGVLKFSFIYVYSQDVRHATGVLTLVMVATKAIAFSLLFVKASRPWFKRVAL